MFKLTGLNSMTCDDSMNLRKLKTLENFYEERRQGFPPNVISSGPDIVYSERGSRNWCSAPRPGPGAGFVVGRTGHWAILTNMETYHGVIYKQIPHATLLPGNDDVLAVDWLNRDTAVGGTRSGRVLLGDVRSNEGDFALRIQAHRGVQHVRVLDSNRILVGALNNKVRTFSL